MKKSWTLFAAALFTPLFLLAQMAGSLDPTFNLNGIINMQVDSNRTAFYRTKVQPDGKILAVGTMRGGLGYATAVLMRYNTDGTLDTSFAQNGIYRNQDQTGYFDSFGTDCHLLPDGRILLVASVVWENQFAVIRLLPNGAHDPTYGNNGVCFFPVNAFLPRALESVLQPDGKIVISGYYVDLSTSVEQSIVARILPEGVIDSSFAGIGYKLLTTPNAAQTLTLGGVTVQPDGKIILPASYGNTFAEAKWYVYRLNVNGDFDPTFGTNGLVVRDLGTSFEEGANTALVLSDGRIVVGGYAQKYPGFHFTMLRLMPDGSTDNSFGIGGKAQLSFNCCYSSIFKILQQPDGKLLACGFSSDNETHRIFSIARFKANGLPDLTFGDAAKVPLKFAHDTLQVALNMALQQDGKILTCGYLGQTGYGGGAILVRLNPGATVGTYTPNAESDFGVKVSPNPVTGAALHVAYTLESATNVSMSLIDLLGRTILYPMQEEWRQEGEQNEDLVLPEALPQGQYLLKIDTEMGSQVVKIVKAGL